MALSLIAFIRLISLGDSLKSGIWVKVFKNGP